MNQTGWDLLTEQQHEAARTAARLVADADMMFLMLLFGEGKKGAILSNVEPEAAVRLIEHALGRRQVGDRHHRDRHRAETAMSEAFDILMASADAMKRGALAIWTVYDRPKDHPNGYIARMHEIADGERRPTDAALTGELEEIREKFWKAGLTKLARSEGDEPQIVESWV
jgi:hypothetical protein